MNKKIIIALVAIVLVAGLGIGSFLVIKAISDENHKKDIEMAADCARTFEMPIHADYPEDYSNGAIFNQGEIRYANDLKNRRRTKRQECAEKYHVTHQEIIDKIGEENYSPR